MNGIDLLRASGRIGRLRRGDRVIRYGDSTRTRGSVDNSARRRARLRAIGRDPRTLLGRTALRKAAGGEKPGVAGRIAVMSRTYDTAAMRGCPTCGLAQRVVEPTPRQQVRCVRCHSVILDGRRHLAAQRTAAVALAALLLYPLAITMPVLELERLGHRHVSSIWSGMVQLLSEGHLLVGLVVLVGSIFVPLAKLIGLFVLCVRPNWPNRKHAAWTYHAIEIAGRWGMIDVLLIAVLVSAVKLGDIVRIEMGPGVIAFTAVVVLSLIASAVFDPHAIWEADS
jgi:paraquat-inducible protein A